VADVADEFADAIEQVHAVLEPGPPIDGARIPAARKGLLKLTHTLREYQQRVDLLMLRAIEIQRAENRAARGESGATRQAVADLHERVDELERRVEILASLNDDLRAELDLARTARTSGDLRADGIAVSGDGGGTRH
jgi:hypothetical protein